MTKAQGVLLLGSHLMFGVLGWLVFGGTGEISADTPKANQESRAILAKAAPDRERNPIFRATGADFRVAWGELLRGRRSERGEPGGDGMSFFIDWCAVDPEGAILGLRDFYAPRFSHNFLRNAVFENGAEMAEPLVEHWEELRFQESSDIRTALSRSLSALSREDPARAAQLAAGLSPEMRAGFYDGLFRSLPLDRLADLSDHLEREMLPEAGEMEREDFWKQLAVAVDRMDPARGVVDWTGRISSREGVEAFVRRGMGNAASYECMPEFIETIYSLEGECRQWAKDAAFEQLERIRDPEVRAELQRQLSVE